MPSLSLEQYHLPYFFLFCYISFPREHKLHGVGYLFALFIHVVPAPLKDPGTQ